MATNKTYADTNTVDEKQAQSDAFLEKTDVSKTEATSRTVDEKQSISDKTLEVLTQLGVEADTTRGDVFELQITSDSTLEKTNIERSAAATSIHSHVGSVLAKAPDVNEVLGKLTGHYEAVTKGVNEVVQIASDAVTLALDAKWIGLSTANIFKKKKDGGNAQASTDKQLKDLVEGKDVATQRVQFDRYDSAKMYSLQIGDYFMPMSQSFTLRAKKRLNVSSLVDGVDIIQQTRKEAKTIDCTLRLTLRGNQPNLEMVQIDQQGKGRFAAEKYTESSSFDKQGSLVQDVEVIAQSKPKEILDTLTAFLSKVYEKDIIVELKNDVITKTFGVSYGIISEYKFTPRHGSGTFIFEFTIVEVDYNANVLEVSKNEIA